MNTPIHGTRRRFIQTTAAAGALATIARPVFAQASEFTFKWANNIPATHPSTIRVREAAEAIKRDSKGRVDIQVFPNNQLGGDTDVGPDPADAGAGGRHQWPGLRVQGLPDRVGGDGR
jgi:TRAP-type mannitol/chloroaromatic compound transport system substrate-binding protein